MFYFAVSLLDSATLRPPNPGNFDPLEDEFEEVSPRTLRSPLAPPSMFMIGLLGFFAFQDNIPNLITGQCLVF